MSTWQLSADEKRAIWTKMRVPVFTFIALLGFLAAIILLGELAPAARITRFLIAGIVLCMILTVLFFAMDVRLEGALMRFYAFLGFCWLTILLGMTMLDYWTR